MYKALAWLVVVVLIIILAVYFLGRAGVKAFSGVSGFFGDFFSSIGQFGAGVHDINRGAGDTMSSIGLGLSYITGWPQKVGEALQKVGDSNERAAGEGPTFAAAVAGMLQAASSPDLKHFIKRVAYNPDIWKGQNPAGKLYLIALSPDSSHLAVSIGKGLVTFRLSGPAQELASMARNRLAMRVDKDGDADRYARRGWNSKSFWHPPYNIWPLFRRILSSHLVLPPAYVVLSDNNFLQEFLWQSTGQFEGKAPLPGTPKTLADFTVWLAVPDEVHDEEDIIHEYLTHLPFTNNVAGQGMPLQFPATPEYLRFGDDDVWFQGSRGLFEA